MKEDYIRGLNEDFFKMNPNFTTNYRPLEEVYLGKPYYLNYLSFT